MQVMVANIGDAKAVLARSSSADQRLKAIVLTREHKAIYTQERTRIQKVKPLSFISIGRSRICIQT